MKYVFAFNSFLKYLLYEIVIKYLLCYVLSGLTLVFSLNLTSNILQTVMLNIASSLMSLPVVFIAYDLYKKVLTHKTTKIINKNVEKEIKNIFLRFLYFVELFYYDMDMTIINPYDIDKGSKRSKNEIFKRLSEHEHPGFFIFSNFDEYDKYIDELIDSNKISKYVSIKELSILQEFISEYRNLKEIFSWITSDDFIRFQKINNLEILISEYTKSIKSNNTFYDIIECIDGVNKIVYTTSYMLFDEEVLSHNYKLSGNKAEEIAETIYKLYICINKWKKARNIDKLTFENGLTSFGRLYLNNSITFNSHMKKNVAFNFTF